MQSAGGRHPRRGPGTRGDPAPPPNSLLSPWLHRSPPLRTVHVTGATGVHAGPGREARLKPAPEPSDLVCVQPSGAWGTCRVKGRVTAQGWCPLRTREPDGQGALSRHPLATATATPEPVSLVCAVGKVTAQSCLAWAPTPSKQAPGDRATSFIPRRLPQVLCPCKL